MIYLSLLFVSWFNIITVSAACRFGSAPSCAFPCNCASVGEVCDPDTGACPQSGCKQTLPPGYGWGGEGCLVGNVAYGKPATQSGDYSESGKTFYANLAVDGYTNPRLESGSCSDTADGGAPRAWWQVDLGALHVIHNVTIYNRGDGFSGYRTDYLAILVGRTESDFTQCARLDEQVPDGEHQTFPCSQPLVGRYVKLLKDDGLYFYDNILNICEFIAMGHRYTDCTSSCPSASCSDLTGCDTCPAGKKRPDCEQDCPDGTYGVDCTDGCGCRDPSEACEKVIGSCTSGCPDWFVGDACTIEIRRPDMSEDKYKPTVSDYTHNTVTITWKKLDSVPDGKYYFYAVEYERNNGGVKTFAIISHTEGPQTQSTTISGLDSRTEYSFRIAPSRNISTNQYKNRHQEYGMATTIITQYTVCPPGTYGAACTEPCHCRDPAERCDIDRGTCTSGCKDWFVGETCGTEITSPDMAAPQYTPQLVSVTQNSITILWKKLDSIPEENYYFYQVEYQKHEEGFHTFLIQAHKAGALEQSTTFDNLESGTKYSFRIAPFRNIHTDQFNNRKKQFGRNTAILVQDTVESTASSAEAAPSSGSDNTANTVNVILGVFVGILGVVSVAAVIYIVVQHRKQDGRESCPKQSIYYNDVSSTTGVGGGSAGNSHHELPSELARSSKILSGTADSGYTTPGAAYSLGQVSEYEDLPAVQHTDYETVE